MFGAARAVEGQRRRIVCALIAAELEEPLGLGELDEPAVRRFFIEVPAFRRTTPLAAIRLLAHLAGDPRAEIRRRTPLALGQLADCYPGEAHAALAALLDDPAPLVRAAARDVARRLGAPPATDGAGPGHR